MKKLLFQGLILFAAMSNISAMEQPEAEDQTGEATYSIELAQELAVKYMLAKEEIGKLEKEGTPESLAAVNHFAMSVKYESFVIPPQSQQILEDKGILEPEQNKISDDMRHIICAMNPANPINN